MIIGKSWKFARGFISIEPSQAHFAQSDSIDIAPMKSFSSFKTFLAALVAALVLMQPMLSMAQRGRIDQFRKPARLSNQQDVQLRADTDGNGVLIRWRTETERGILGFEVHRIGSGRNTKINLEMISGAGIFSDEIADRGAERFIFDVEGGVGSFYRIDARLLDGSTRGIGFVSANFVNDLRSVSDHTAAEYRERAIERREEFLGFEPKYPKDLADEITASEIPANLETNRWVAAQPGVKIAVKQEGFYRVSRSELAAAGFDVDVPGRFWRLFLDGVEQNIVVGPEDAFIEFYGRNQDTRESGEKVYFLIGGDIKGRRMGIKRSRLFRGSETVDFFNETARRKPRTEYVTDLRNGDVENYFGGPFGATGAVPQSLTVRAPGIVSDTHDVTVTFKVQGLTTVLPQDYEFSLNGSVLGTVRAGFQQNTTRTYTVSSGLINPEGNQMVARGISTGHFALVDSFSISYRRGLRADSNQLKFYSGTGKTATVSGFESSSIRVFDITAPDRPRLIDQTSVSQAGDGTFTASFGTDTARSVYAFDENALLSPASISFNTPSNLSDPSNQGHLLIVTHKNFMTEAQLWADWRRTQGHSVYVADIEDVLDEYGYGTISTVGMRAFFEMASTTWADPARYVLLIGDASYDYRRYQSTQPFINFVPTRLFDTFTEETASDDWLTDFNGDGIAEIPIGRLSVRTTGVVPIYLSKTQNFESGVSSDGGITQRGTVLAFDDPESTQGAYPFDRVSQDIANKMPSGTPNTLVDRRAVDAKTSLVNALNAGPFAANYSGHGSLRNWYGTTFFGANEASALTNSTRPTLFTMVTCLNGQFHTFSQGSSLAELLTENPSGGAVASWASTGKTTADVQDVMINRFYLKLAEGSIPRLGNLVIDAKGSFLGSRDVKLSWVIIGDPMLKVR